MDGWVGEWMDGWMDGRMDGRMDGWMDGWMDEWTYISVHPCLAALCDSVKLPDTRATGSQRWYNG